MNLEESNDFVKKMEKNNKNRKTVVTIFIICVILIAVLYSLITVIRAEDNAKLKMFINDQQAPISSTLLIQEENVNYINVKQLAEMLGYSYQNGEYKKYTEDDNSCYLKSEYEVVSMTADSKTATKYILNEKENLENESENASENKTTNDSNAEEEFQIVVDSPNETSETFSLKQPLIYTNDELYVPFDEVSRLFNVMFSYNGSNRIRIYSLKYATNLGIQTATKLNYKEVSNIYENLTAIFDNMLVVSNGKNYGVISLENNQEIISMKYDKIVYMQNSKEFFVTAEDSVGIVDHQGKTIIKPTEYDSITNFDEKNKLYLVEKNNRYGVLNKEGEVIVYPEYDSIGIENSDDFENDNIRNFNLLFEKCIPVESNGKYGLIDIDGNEKLKCVYDYLGYLSNATVTSSEDNKDKKSTNTTNTTSQSYVSTNEYGNLLTIPKELGIEGIIINLNGQYGLYDALSERLIIPCACSKIYSKTKAGKTTYYLEYEGNEIELESYLDENDLKNKENNSNNESSEDEQQESQEESNESEESTDSEE